MHPVITLSNADRIEAGESFDFYRQGVTPMVAETLAAADAERLRVALAYGVPAFSLRDWIARAYDHHADTLLQAVGGNPSYVGIKAPTTIHHRYLLEDVPTGLIPLLHLGRAAGLELPVLTTLVEEARIKLSGRLWQLERSLDRLDLDGLGATQIRAHIERGRVSSVTKSMRIYSLPLQQIRSGLELLPQA